MFRPQSTGLSVGCRNSVGPQVFDPQALDPGDVFFLSLLSPSAVGGSALPKRAFNISGPETCLVRRPSARDVTRPHTPPGNVTLGQIYHPHTTTTAAPPVPAPRTLPTPLCSLVHHSSLLSTLSPDRVAGCPPLVLVKKPPPLDTTAI